MDTRAESGRHLLSKAYAGQGAGAWLCLGLSTKPKGSSWSRGILRTPLLPEAAQAGIKIVLKEC